MSPPKRHDFYSSFLFLSTLGEPRHAPDPNSLLCALSPLHQALQTFVPLRTRRSSIVGIGRSYRGLRLQSARVLTAPCATTKCGSLVQSTMRGSRHPTKSLHSCKLADTVHFISSSFRKGIQLLSQGACNFNGQLIDIAQREYIVRSLYTQVRFGCYTVQDECCL